MNEKRLKIPLKVFDALLDLADKRGISVEDAFRQAVNTEVYMNEELSKGNEILCREPGGKTWRVVFTHMQ